MSRILEFSKVPLKSVTDFVKQNHYSHTHTCVCDYNFALTFNGKLAGACLYGKLAGALCWLNGETDHHNYRELTRLVLLDEVPKNSESQFIGWTLRWLRKNTNLAGVISYADPLFGHTGGVYQATNWIYTGKQEAPGPRIAIDGKEVPARTLYKDYGTLGIKSLREKGLNASALPRVAKHRYVYILRPELQSKLKYPRISYPVSGELSG